MDCLNFTAEAAWSTIKLTQNWTPTAVTLETSTDKTTWTSYTIWDTITLANVWDKIYMRNTSTTDTWFSVDYSNCYQFVMTWSINWSWDINYLLNKNSTTSLSSYCYVRLFMNCTSLTSSPELPATTLWTSCYQHMFYWCTSLVNAPALPATTLWNNCYQSMFVSCTLLSVLPKLPALTMPSACYNSMFNGCTKIKLSATKTWEYQTPYRIPTAWSWNSQNNSLNNMFYNTWWTFTWKPLRNTTYYTSNTVV